MTQVCSRHWVEADSDAFRALIQQGYLVVPKSAKYVGKRLHRVRWILMQKMVEVDEPAKESQP